MGVSSGVMENIKFQAAKLKVSSFRCQQEKTETLNFNPEWLYLNTET
jgi:hypothetical protein